MSAKRLKKWQKEIVSQAKAGLIVEFRFAGDWTAISGPGMDIEQHCFFDDPDRYQVRKDKNAPVIRTKHAFLFATPAGHLIDHLSDPGPNAPANLQLFFDPDTGDLIDAKLMKP